MVKEELQKLQDLQDILSEKYKIESELKEIPKALSTKTELVSRLKKSFIDRNNNYEESKKRIAELKNLMLEAESDREKYESQIVDISTQREYEALVREIRDASDREQNFRKDLQREEKNLEEMKLTLEREEALIKEQENELNKEQEKIEQDTRDRSDQLNNLDDKEKNITPGMDEEIIFKFKRIIKSKGGRGIVPLRGGVCTGCNMILPAQFVNDVRKGEEILFCPYCSMILYYEEADTELFQFESSNDLFDDEDDEFMDEFSDEFDDDVSDDSDEEDEEDEEDDFDDEDEEESDEDEDEDFVDDEDEEDTNEEIDSDITEESLEQQAEDELENDLDEEEEE